MLHNNLQKWMLHSPLGRYILSTERTLYHNWVHNIFGYYSLQIGFDKINFLQGNRINKHYVIDNDIKCDLHFLPFAENSIDLIICPHILEFLPNYPQFLQECYRALIPNGKLIITSFNPKSMLGLMHKKITPLKNANLIKLEILQQQLQELNFSLEGGKFFCYRPPFKTQATLAKLHLLDKIGDRWFPTFSNSYALFASKEIATPTPIKPLPQINYASDPLTAKLGNM